ncbi:MAG: hypothetical protein ACQEP0_10785 [Natrinema limicola]
MTTPPVLVVEARDVFGVVGGLAFRLEGIREGTGPVDDGDEPVLDLLDLDWDRLGDVGCEPPKETSSVLNEVNCRGEHRCLQ